MSPDASIEEILASYRTNLESRNQLTQEDEELIMQLSETYLKRRQEWKAEGLEEGRQEGQQLALRSVAVSLLQEGIEATIIAKTTGLSIAAVEQLRQELGH
jgi:predicted transposase/invertase (TIGR01784 family)